MAQKKARVDAEQLGIDLSQQSEHELFKWLVACLLFAKPVQQEMAGRAFAELEHKQLANPEALQRAGWQRLVETLDDAHYVRYDESTATRLLEAAETLKQRYGGSMRSLVGEAHNQRELSQRLQTFNGIGPTASSIFVRDLRKAGWRPA